MLERAIRVLELDHIRARLRRHTVSEEGMKRAEALFPSFDVYEINMLLDETRQASDLILAKGPLPIWNLYSIAKEVELAQKGISLTTEALLNIVYNEGRAFDVIGFLKGEMPDISIISRLASRLNPHKGLKSDIEAAIVAPGQLADDASPLLKHLRKSIQLKNLEIRERLNKLISGDENQKIFQDALVTMRDGRYVVPVKAEMSGSFAGIVHDRSKGGSTFFMEPQDVVNINNKLRELELQEKEEVERILAEFTSRVAECADEILDNYRTLVELDFIMAKGQLAVEMDAQRPEMIEGSQNKEIKLIKARHPMLDKTKVVPVSIMFEGGCNTLIITGPNTGGKTVSLKTLGLLSMMAQCGLMIPASERSMLPVFGSYYVDIGDEQSIEQSLSTFSSHMKNIVEIIDGCNDDSLVLLDEVGAGTDPNEGAALAVAIIETLMKRDCTIMATTHYNQLKHFAIGRSGITNASMEFDMASLTPTYRLKMGLPGSSCAFEISRRLGLSEELVDRALELVEKEDIKFEEVLAKVEAAKQQAERERDEAIAINIAIKKREEELLDKERRLEQRRESIIASAKEDARLMIEEAKSSLKETEAKLRKVEKEGYFPGVFQKDKEKLSHRLKEYSGGLVKKVNSEPVDLNEIKVGSLVKVLTLDQNGTVITEADSKGKFMVQVGSMRMKLSPRDIMLLTTGLEKKEKPKKPKSSVSMMKNRKLAQASTKVDLRRKNLNDAILDLDKYLDQCFLAGLGQATVVHGHGEGILRQGVREHLKNHPNVKRIERMPYNEGGEGATLVIFKD